MINKNDSAKGTQWGTGATNQGMYPGSLCGDGRRVARDGHAQHQGGLQDTWGRYRQHRSANGDLRATFINGVASTVTILNTPVNFQDNLKADLGIYGQDSWTFNRLTINYGARWEYFASGIPEETSGIGTFRDLDAQLRTDRHADLDQLRPARRFQYDLFGNQKTALKFSIGRARTGRDDRLLESLQSAGAAHAKRGVVGLERRMESRRASSAASTSAPGAR